MKRFTFWLWCIAITLLPLSAGAVFSDVAEGSSFFIPVNFLANEKIIEGFSDGTFRTDQPVARAEALAMILKATGREIKTPPSGADVKKPFRDVGTKKWFYGAVSEAKRLGLVTGYKNGAYFQPAAPITLAETLRMLFQSSETDTEGFFARAEDTTKYLSLPPGLAEDHWYSDDVAYALAHSILSQQENGSIYDPGKTLTRGQMALLLYRFLKVEDGARFGYASWYGDRLSKIDVAEAAGFIDRALTAAHKTIPIGTILRVTNMYNGKYVDVVVNDRGPYIKGRIIDLSKSAFSHLASPGTGVIAVQIEKWEK